MRGNPAVGVYQLQNFVTTVKDNADRTFVKPAGFNNGKTGYHLHLRFVLFRKGAEESGMRDLVYQ